MAIASTNAICHGVLVPHAFTFKLSCLRPAVQVVTYSLTFLYLLVSSIDDVRRMDSTDVFGIYSSLYSFPDTIFVLACLPVSTVLI